MFLSSAHTHTHTHRYWANLAASGNPNKPGNSTLQIHWPQYSTDSDEVRVYVYVCVCESVLHNVLVSYL
jgi:carboxylesterase type B